MTVRVYEKSTCSTCRELMTLLRTQGIEFEQVEYHVFGLTEPEVRGLLKMSGMRAAEALRLKEDGATALLRANEDEIVRAMVERPELLQRPFVVVDDRAVLARPVERALELFA